MKVRDRKQRVLPNIRQEGQKPLFTSMDPSNVTSEDAKIFDLTIKQEETKDHRRLSNQDAGDLDKKEYRYQCNLCKMKMATFTSVLEHRTSIHGIKQFSKRVIKNIDVEPDIYDSNLYCKSCERSYSTTRLYRYHLKHTHYMILKSMPKWNTPKNDIDPDPNNPNFYCRACDFTYKRKDAYKRHCRFAHGLNTVKFADRRSTSSSLTNSYCHVCDKRLSSIPAYRQHLFAIHKIDSRPFQQERNNIMPNVNDPNFHCRSCEKKLSGKESFGKHLKQVHSIFKSAPKESSLKPDVDDPNNHCLACQKTYTSKGRYREHLRTVHQMRLTPLRCNIRREQLPDPYSRDHYCSVCRKTYASLQIYRLHCKRVHFMELNHAFILNPQADINVNDPKLYCAQCENSFRDKSSFRQHLARVHSMY